MKSFRLLLSTALATSAAAGYAAVPLELIRTQDVFAGESAQVNLGLFYTEDVFANADIELNTSEGISAEWEDRQTGFARIAAGESGPRIGWIALRFGDTQDSASIPVRVLQEHYHEFSLDPEGDVESLFVAGDFNSWSRDNDELGDEDGDGFYTVRLPIEPGTHQYKFVLNGEWMADPANPNQTSDGYGNSIFTVEGNAAGARPQIIRNRAEQTESGTSLIFNVSAEGTPRFLAFLDNEFLGDTASADSPVTLAQSSQEQTLAINLPAATGAEVVRVLGETSDGALFPEQLVLLHEGKPLGRENRGDTWRSAILYYAFIDRFSNGDPANDAPVTGVAELTDAANWQGGDLKGLLDRIESGYFDDLGINTLWLSPLNRQFGSAEVEFSEPHRLYTAYHGYWPISEDEVEPRFGDEELLTRVVETAHQHGIKVILDLVAHHVHEDHPIHQQYPEWFGELELPDGRMNIKLFDEHRLTTWFDTFLPTFNYFDNPDAIEHMADNALWWLETFHLDGFRHDATKHIPHEFWQALTRRIRTRYEPTAGPTYQVGETISGRDLIFEYARGGELDGQFDFPLYWPTREVLGMRKDTMERLARAVQDSLDVYGPEPIQSALIGNHDVTRFMAYADGDLDGSLDGDGETTFGFENHIEVDHDSSYEKIGVAFTLLLTIPSVPMIYYGDEIGLTGANDPDNRRMMQFDELSEAQQRLKGHVAQLTRLRSEHPALYLGDHVSLQTGDDTWVYACVNFDETVIVALNRGDAEETVSFDLPATVGPIEAITPLLGSGAAHVENRHAELTLPPRSGQLFQAD